MFFSPQKQQVSPNNSDSGLSVSSSSSGEIMGTPFDYGAQRFEYPFPQAQGSPTDAFLPSITPHSHPQLPPWPIHISKSFPLTPPPLGKGKLKAHPKLRSNVREPPVPPGLVKRRSRIAGLQHQSSSEEPSDRSDVGDDLARVHKSPPNATKPVRHPLQSDMAPHDPAEIVPMKQALSLPVSFDPDPAGLAKEAAPSPRPQVRESKFHEHIHIFAVYCALVAGQLCRWFLRFLGFSRA